MIKIIFKDMSSKDEAIVEAKNGQSLMEVAIENSIPGIIAECGGACSCATCHVYVDTQWLSLLPPMDIMEEDMLDFAINVKESSRLSCQINITDDLEGMVVYVPDSQ